MNFLIQWLKDHNIKTLQAEYVSTNKNPQVEQFYDMLGLTVIDNNINVKKYSLNLSDYIFKKIEYIAIDFPSK